MGSPPKAPHHIPKWQQVLNRPVSGTYGEKKENGDVEKGSPLKISAIASENFEVDPTNYPTSFHTLALFRSYIPVVGDDNDRNVNEEIVGKSKSSTREKYRWQAFAVLFQLFEVMCVFAMMLSTNFRTCLKMADCNLGEVCVNDKSLPFDHPQCRDCAYLTTHYDDDTIEKWSLVNTYGADDWPADGIATTPRDVCIQELERPIISYLDLKDYNKCIYFIEAIYKTGLLDSFVRIGAFLLLSLAVGMERQERCVADFVRKTLHSEQPPSWRNRLWKVQLMLTDNVMLSMTPAAMLVLLAAHGVDSVSCILNGLAVGVIVEMDNMIFSAILSQHGAEVIAQQVKLIISHHCEHTDDFHSFCRRRGTIRTILTFVYLLVVFELMKDMECNQVSCCNFRSDRKASP